MATEITMPKLGLTMTTGKVGRWLVQEGSPVKQGEALLEIMTDKITNVIESPSDGVLLKIIVREGAELPVGVLHLTRGPSKLVIEPLSMPGQQVMEWHHVRLRRQ